MALFDENDRSVLFLFVFLGSLLLVHATKHHRQSLPLPPGPPGLPFIGSYFSMPSHSSWLTYAGWAQKYASDVVSVTVFGQTIVILNSYKAAQALLDRRSNLYSDRPTTSLITMAGWDWFLAFLPYSDIWRSRRRLFQQNFREKACVKYQPVLRSTSEQLVKRLYNEPDKFLHVIHLTSSSISFMIAYGYKVNPHGDPLVSLIEEAGRLLGTITLPGASIINEIPLVRHFPGWFPGMSFKIRAKRCKAVMYQVLEEPLERVKKQLADGTARHSLATELLGTNEVGIAQTDDAIRDVAGAVYSAGGETITAGLHFTILSLVLHPEVQKRAQAEIDRIVGRGRLPDFSDQSSLPYVSAVFREIMRWSTAVPLGLPHAVTQDDEYEGYHIPRGAVITANTWAMLHDPEKYPDPHVFKPERFLREDGTLNNDDVQIAFGFGRRICPGIHIARASLWIMIASLLATLRIEPAKDAAGRETPINEDRVEGIVSTPVGFECSIVPRDAKARALLDSLA